MLKPKTRSLKTSIVIDLLDREWETKTTTQDVLGSIATMKWVRPRGLDVEFKFAGQSESQMMANLDAMTNASFITLWGNI